MKRILGFVLIVAGIIIFLFFRGYSGGFIPYPILWFLIGAAFVAVGVILLVKSKSKFEKKHEESIRLEIEKLKKHGKRINVQFKDCEIISSNYYKEIPKSSNYRIQAWDSLYDNSNTVKTIEINQSRIVFQDKSSTDNYTFISPIINKDKATLYFTLEKFKETTLYVNKDDIDLYYFDLEFLNKE